MKMIELNQKYVIESVTQFLEKGRNGFDGYFNIKCESGKVTMDLSVALVLGCQEQSGKDDSDLGSYLCQTKTSKKRSRKSPSKLRRNLLRAEKYRAKKSMIQIDNENCFTSTTEEVHISEDFPVVNNVETDKDSPKVNVVDSIEDNASTMDYASTYKDVIDEDGTSDRNATEANYLVFTVFCETYVNELRTGRISRSIRAYEKEDYEERPKWRAEFEWAPSGYSRNFFAMYSDKRVFKEYYGFEEGGGFDEDISWIDYDNLYLYSKNSHSRINYDLQTGDWIVIVEI